VEKFGQKSREWGSALAYGVAGFGIWDSALDGGSERLGGGGGGYVR
jgi:hypothetical protein